MQLITSHDKKDCDGKTNDILGGIVDYNLLRIIGIPATPATPFISYDQASHWFKSVQNRLIVNA